MAIHVFQIDVFFLGFGWHSRYWSFSYGIYFSFFCFLVSRILSGILFDTVILKNSVGIMGKVLKQGLSCCGVSLFGEKRRSKKKLTQ